MIKEYVFYDIERDMIFSIKESFFFKCIQRNFIGEFALENNLETYLKDLRSRPEKWLELGTV